MAGHAAFVKWMPGIEPPDVASRVLLGDFTFAYPTAIDGAFDLAMYVDAGDAIAAADALLAMITGDAAADRITAHTEHAIEPFEDLPVHIFRAMDGWLAVAFPEREAWHAFTMAFLRRGMFRRVPHDAAWHSAEANELATLVLDTHHADDAEGTAQTYGVPCVALPDWQDEAQAKALGVVASRTPSYLLADVIRYAALVPMPAADVGSAAGFRRRLEVLLGEASPN